MAMSSKIPLAATGTAGSATAIEVRNERPDSAKECVTVRTEASEEEKPDRGKPLQIADLCDEMPEDAADDETASCRTRTYNPLIKSQLLCQLS